MPRREDLRSILVIGSGPIVIGQACEFDYSGTQACRVLKSEGYRVILVNSNPATIMTDPQVADATYVEPINPQIVTQVIESERPDGLLATLGGQTALNVAVALSDDGTLAKYGVELLGASVEAIQRGENRESFKQVVTELTPADTPSGDSAGTTATDPRPVRGKPLAEVARSRICNTMDEVLAAANDLGLPLVVRPSFTMGGAGSGFAHTESELRRIAGAGLAASPTAEVLIEESILGWKEYELEVMRDRADNVVIVCSIENLDPMGVHTGDSITVAPAMTLTDREYQRMRDVALAIIRNVGVDTGGCNIQFAIDPRTGRMIVIEMNPRVSRSSALASKASGFPIAKIAAKLAVGYTLDEIPNDITSRGGTPTHGGTPPGGAADDSLFEGERNPSGDPLDQGAAGAEVEVERDTFWTPASFEPALDYVVVKAPRFAFEKFPGADSTLTTHMKSVGEAMAIGRNFTEALGKALRSLENPDAPFRVAGEVGSTPEELLDQANRPHDGRIGLIFQAIRAGADIDQVHRKTGVDPWFIDQLMLIEQTCEQIRRADELTAEMITLGKRHGLSDIQIGQLRHLDEQVVRGVRWALGLRPVYKTVDTCAAEFAAKTPYHYSSYDTESEVEPRTRPAVIILGSGPNRIGQGIEFDYSCVHASMTLRDAGYETIMINCNPETVSTDYDTSDRLYFEPLTCEDVLEVVHAESRAGPIAGVVVQLGGQTPLGLAQQLKDAGVPVVGTSPEAINACEERGAFGDVLERAGLLSPKHGLAPSFDEARRIAAEIGYPVLARPSYVLGGRGMEIVYDEGSLSAYIGRATEVSPEHPVLVDRFLDDAVEIDVDALYDGSEVYLGGVMEHIEEAGVHSGDSACVLPPITLAAQVIENIKISTERIAREVGVRGLLNIQFAVAGDTLYVLEANPRASRTVPFVSKATWTQLAKAAARIMLGSSVAELRQSGMLRRTGDGADEPAGAPIAVKEAVMPFNRFRTVEGISVDTVLGPEMKSTGEVMGLDGDFGIAFAKSQQAAFGSLPTGGRVFVSAANRDKRHLIMPVKRLADLGFEILATTGTASVLERNGVAVTLMRKHSEGTGPYGEKTIVQAILDDEVDLIFNTPQGQSHNGSPRFDGYEIRTAAVARNVPCMTTVQGLIAAVQGIEALRRGPVGVRSLQDWERVVDSIA